MSVEIWRLGCDLDSYLDHGGNPTGPLDANRVLPPMMLILET
jgi:hypothetical protein